MKPSSKKGILLLLVTFQLSMLCAQTLTPRVICSGYGSGQGGGIKLNYTIGETFVTTLRSGNTVLTQGFHQPEVNACPTAPLVANLPENINLSCEDSIPAFDPGFYMPDGSAVSVTQINSVTSDGCITIYLQEWIGVNQCNDSTVVSRIITLIDTQAPILFGCPSDQLLSCELEAPAPTEVTASDNCDSNVAVTMVETCIGCAASGGVAYDLFTPARPIDNPCNYPYDWAMALFSLPSNYRWYQLDTATPAQIVYNPNGTVTVSGRVFNVVNPAGGFDFVVTYGAPKDWAAWTSDVSPSGFKADCGGEDGNFQDWTYYILQPGASVELTGWGSLGGSLLNLTHAPSNQYFGFQLGDGANNYNADYGAGGWFNYSGVFLDGGQPVTSGLSGGIGDFAFRVDQCPDYSIVRTWTAIDCAGNTSSCSQTILFSAQDNNLGMVVAPENNGQDRESEIAIVGIQPNPASNNSMISFTSTINGKLSLEVLDMTGRVIGNLFNNEAEAGVVYTANFDASQLASGIYMVRLSSGTAFEIERMQIQK